MSGIDRLKTRINYRGGFAQQDRMIRDKLASLKKALLYSYQAGTMVIDNPGHDPNAVEGLPALQQLEFRCLMNPDKLNKNTDLKMVSVPYEDICLNLPRPTDPGADLRTTSNFTPNPISVGDTFIWKETNTRWIVIWRYVEELAYFRADTRKCYPHPIQINENDYYFATVGPNEVSNNWTHTNSIIRNSLNYTQTLYIKRNEETLSYFARNKKIKIRGMNGDMQPWKVEAVERNSIDDILLVHIKEDFTDKNEEITEAVAFEKEYADIQADNLVVHVYDEFTYTVPYVEGAAWDIQNIEGGLKFDLDATYDAETANTTATVGLLTGRTGEFDLIYNNAVATHVVVKSI